MRRRSPADRRHAPARRIRRFFPPSPEPLERRIVLDGSTPAIALDSGVAQGAVYSGGFVAVPASVLDYSQLDDYLATHPVVASPAFDATFAPVTAGLDGQFPIGYWMPDGPTSAWIAPNIHGQASDGLAPFVNTAAGFDPDTSAPMGLFYYTTTFQLGADAHVGLVGGSWTDDNLAIAIFLNGVPQESVGVPPLDAMTPFQLDEADFVAGQNTLTFVSFNEGFGNGHPTPAGLRVEGSIGPAGSHDGSLSGAVDDDANDDGRKGPDEDGLAGVTVTLTGTLDQGGSVTRTTTTRSDGSYRFDQLAPGTYALAEDPPAGSIGGKTGVGTLGGVAGTGQITGIGVDVNSQGTGYDFGMDRPPTFTSTPIPAVPAGAGYDYQVAATDPDGDPLTYTLLSGPVPQLTGTNELSWSPTQGDVGTHAVAIRVSDGRGGVAEQDFTITVTDAVPDTPPAFTSTPVVDAYVGTLYSYQATASDPDRDEPLDFSWDQSQHPLPAGMSDPDPGLATVPDAAVVQWTPTPDQVGPHTVTLAVADDDGFTAARTFTIVVHPTPGNAPPLITSSPVEPPVTDGSTPVVAVTAGQRYVYQVTSIEDDDDTRTYALDPAATALGMAIDPQSGRLTWDTTGVALGSYPVTVTVDDGHGYSDAQGFTIDLTDANTIEGRVTSFPAPPGGGDDAPPRPITLALTNAPFNLVSALAYDEPDHTILTLGNPYAADPAIEEVWPDGTQRPFSGLAGVNQEVKFAAAATGNPGGFTPGDVFVLRVWYDQVGNPQTVVSRISDGGRTVIPDWATLTGEGDSSYQGGVSDEAVTFDTTGVFGGDLIVSLGSSGDVWRIDAQGQATFWANLPGVDPEGLATVPDDPARYGPLAGTIVATSEGEDGIYAIDAQQVVTYHDLGLPSLETIDLIPAGANFFADSFGYLTGDGHPASAYGIVAAPASDFAPMVGDLLLTQEFHGNFFDGQDHSDDGSGLYRLRWDADAGTLVAEEVPLAGTSFPGGAWEHVLFAPVGIAPVAAVPGPDWTVYLDLNGNGQLDAGAEPSTVTDADGDYAFRDVASGTYTVAVVPQAGWTETRPTAGTYTVTLSGDQAARGLDFTEVEDDPNGPERPPQFDTTPTTTTAPAGRTYAYDAHATDPDHDRLTYALAAGPAGMAVNPATGVLVWRPTTADVARGPRDVLLSVSDGRGQADFQRFQVTATLANLPPEFRTAPTNPIRAGSSYSYQAVAGDDDGESVSYTLAPDGDPLGDMDVTAGGLLTWTAPAVTQVTTVHATLVADDGHGLTTRQPLVLTVVPDSGDGVPVIYSEPGPGIPLGRTYRYQVAAIDLDGDPLSYVLDAATDAATGAALTNLTFDPATGRLAWAPTRAQTGRIVLHVEDGHGGVSPPQDFTVAVVVQGDPQITGTPPTSAAADRPYEYDPQVEDVAGGPFFWSLDAAPAGMRIDPGTGVVTWMPADDQADTTATVTVRVIDGQGEAATQSYTVAVTGADLPPTVASPPPTHVTAETAYTYAIAATDPEGDPLTYTLLPGSAAWLAIADPGAGVIAGTAPAATGDPAQDTYPVAFEVADDAGNAVTVTYAVLVDDVPAVTNAAPTVVTTPPQTADPAAGYAATITATDPDAHDAAEGLAFTLVQDTSGWLAFDPATLVVDPDTGAIRETLRSSGPAPADGTYDVTIAVDDRPGDPADRRGFRSFTLTVAADAPPTIAPLADQTIVLGQPFHRDTQAGDADGDPLTYALSSTDPAGVPAWLTVDAAGRIGGTPPADATADLGAHHLTVTVTDPAQAAAAASFTLTVQADQGDPTVRIDVASPAPLGTTVPVLVTAGDDAGIAGLDLDVDGTHHRPGGDGTVWLAGLAVGAHTLTATATDLAGNTATATATLRVFDPAAAGPTVAIDDPAERATVTAPAPVTGSVVDPALVSYTLAVAPLGSVDFVPFSTYYAQPDHVSPADVAINDAGLGTFDPTMLADGAYDLRLSATNAGGQTTTADRTVNVAGRLKLGNLHLSFTDLTIPVAGIPITITRTYDTLNAPRRGDFGPGWTLDEGDFQLRVDTPDGGLAGVSTPFQDNTRVVITRPGHDPEGFTFQPREVLSSIYTGSRTYQPAFTPDSDVTDTLAVETTGLYDTLYPNGDGTYSGSDLDATPYNPADSLFGGTYTLATHEGLTYTFYADTGRLAAVTDRNGNTLTYDDTGIVSDTGRQVSFTRDPDTHAITAITDPRGNAITYAYDPATGDLATVTDRAAATTTFVYSTAAGVPAHYLDHVVDPAGHTVAQVTYDSTDHRVAGLTDALGNTTALAYDLANLSETVTPPPVDGNPSPSATVTFDTRGNVTGGVDPLGHTSSATYQGDDLTSTTETVAGRALTTTYTPGDVVGETAAATDPLQHTTSFTYNPYGATATTTDPLGHTTTLDYDAKGNPTATTSPTGLTTAYAYYPNGLVESVTGLDGTTAYTYDTFGDVTGTTDPRGNTTTFTYDADGNLLASDRRWTDPTGRDPAEHDLNTQDTYDGDDRVIMAVAAVATVVNGQLVFDAQQETVTDTVYDAQGRAAWSDDPHLPGAPHVDGTETFYDAAGRVVGTEQFHDVVIAFRDLGTAHPSSYLGSQGAPFSASATVYDAQGRVAWSDDPHQFDPNGAPYAADGTHTIYDAAGRVVSTERYHHVVITLSQDPSGAWSSTATADPNPFAVSSTVYDEAGRVVWTDDPHAPGTTPDGTHTTYDDAGRATSTERYAAVAITPGTGAVTHGALVATTSTTYEAAGRAITSTDADNNTTTSTYDPDGNLTRTTDPYGNATSTLTTTVQDGWATTVHPDGSVTSDAAPDTYDELGNPIPAPNGRTVLSYDPLGQATTRIYNARGDLTEVDLPAVTDPTSSQLTTPQYLYTYDTSGNLASVTDPLGHTTTFAYDAQGHKVAETLPQLADLTTPTATWTYDGLGQLASATDFDGQVITYAYDPEGRLQEKDEYTDATAAQQGPSAASKVVTYTYDNHDAASRRYDTVTVTVDTANPGELGATDTYYDTAGNVVEVASPQGDITYTYDDATGQKKSVSTTTNTHIAYAYDGEGRLQTVTATTLDGQAQNLVTSYTYDAAGNLKTTTFPNGTVEARTYDQDNRLTSVVTTRGSTVLAGYTYALDRAGRRTAVTDQGTDALGNDRGRYVTYSYDADGRLTGETVYSSPTATDPDRIATYSYDLAGNRSEWTDTGDPGAPLDPMGRYIDLTSTYDADNRLTDISGVRDGQDYDATYQDDPAGNPLTVTVTTYDSNGNPLDSTTTNTWDLEGRLITAVTTGGSDPGTVGDTYDAAGHRTSETVDGATTTDLNDPTQAYDQALEEYADNGVLAATYVRGLDLLFQDRSGTPSYYAVDGLGSTRALTDASGTVIDTDTYDAAGNLTASTGSTTNEVRYAGYSYDTATLRYHTASRDYDPVTGGFLSRDSYDGSASDPITQNHYLYANADPMLYTDPSGMSSVPGYVYKRVGIKAHWIFSVYVYARGLAMRPGATLGTLFPGIFSDEEDLKKKPDLVDQQDGTYFELKPVTWSNDTAKLGLLGVQMKSYDDALSGEGYIRGNSPDLTFSLPKLPIGIVFDAGQKYLVSLRPANPQLKDGSDGQGVLWYELDPIKNDDFKDQEDVPVPLSFAVPQETIQSIRVFKPPMSSEGLNSDWAPYGVTAVAIASHLMTRYIIGALGANAAMNVTGAYTVSFTASAAPAFGNAMMGDAA